MSELDGFLVDAVRIVELEDSLAKANDLYEKRTREYEAEITRCKKAEADNERLRADLTTLWRLDEYSDDTNEYRDILNKYRVMEQTNE